MWLFVGNYYCLLFFHFVFNFFIYFFLPVLGLRCAHAGCSRCERTGWSLTASHGLTSLGHMDSAALGARASWTRIEPCPCLAADSQPLGHQEVLLLASRCWIVGGSRKFPKDRPRTVRLGAMIQDYSHFSN